MGFHRSGDGVLRGCDVNAKAIDPPRFARGRPEMIRDKGKDFHRDANKIE